MQRHAQVGGAQQAGVVARLQPQGPVNRFGPEM